MCSSQLSPLCSGISSSSYVESHITYNDPIKISTRNATSSVKARTNLMFQKTIEHQQPLSSESQSYSLVHSKPNLSNLKSRVSKTIRPLKKRRTSSTDSYSYPSASSRRKWTIKEDAILSRYMKNPHCSRDELFSILNRTSKQCRERWANHLSKQFNSAKIEGAEMTLLLKVAPLYQNKWSEIAKRWSTISQGRFGNRSALQLKNSWHAYQRRQSKYEQNTIEESADNEDRTFACQYSTPESSDHSPYPKIAMDDHSPLSSSHEKTASDSTEASAHEMQPVKKKIFSYPKSSPIVNTIEKIQTSTLPLPDRSEISKLADFCSQVFEGLIAI